MNAMVDDYDINYIEGESIILIGQNKKFNSETVSSTRSIDKK